MALMACELADDVVITSDNPRTEDPLKIIDDVLAGAGERSVEIFPDRAHAIDQIIQAAEPTDVILIAGKGHEDYQIIGSERIDFDDRIIARKSLESRP